MNSKKTIVQTIVEWITFALLGIVLFGNLLGAIGNAVAFFTFKVSLICTGILAFLFLVILVLIKTKQNKWRLKNGTTINIISLNRRIIIPMIGITILIWLPPILKKFQNDPKSSYSAITFDKTDTTELKILLLPFRPDIKSREIDIDYKAQLLERLETLKESKRLNIKVLDLNNYPTPKTEGEAISIGNEKNADMVIWGSYEENETVGKTNRIRLRYVLITNFEIDNSKKIGDTEMQDVSNLSQLRHGYLQENIEYVIFWIQGIYYYKLGDIKNSASYFNQIITIPQYYTDIESYFRLFDILTDLGENKKAIEISNTYYEELLRKTPVDSLALSKVMCKLASIYSQSDFKKAFNLIDSAVNIQRSSNFSCKSCLASSLYTYAMIKGTYGDFERAESLVNESIQILKQEKREFELCNNYNLLADIYLGEKRYKEAIVIFNKSLELYNKYYPKDYFSKGSLFGTLSLTYYYQGDSTLSWKYIDSSLLILESKLPPNHPSLSTVYNTKGLLYMDKRNFEEGIKLYKKALAISISNLGEYNMEVGGEFNNIALSYLKWERYDSAEKYFNRGLAVLNKTYDKPSIYHAIVYDNLACVYSFQNIYDKAIQNSNTAISIAKETHSQKLGDFYLKLAGIYKDKGDDRNKALHNVELAIQFYRGKEDFKPDLNDAIKLKNELLNGK